MGKLLNTAEGILASLYGCGGDNYCSEIEIGNIQWLTGAVTQNPPAESGL
jgi:hypothetical protein